MIINNYPNYSINKDGVVLNIKKNKPVQTQLTYDGYKSLKLYNDGKSKRFTIHRLLGLHFIPLVEGKDIMDHINRNKLDNRLENLRWVNKSENNSNRNAYKNSKLKERYITTATIYNYKYFVLTIRNHKFRKQYNIKKYTLEYVKNIRDNIINAKSNGKVEKGEAIV